MIIFLTLLYVGVLAALVQFKVIQLNLWWKLSPMIWMLFLLVALFLPMQWGAPVGTVNVYQPVIEIVPNVSGEVIEVAAEGSTQISKGDPLFKIDPVPYQAEVDRIEAALKESEQIAKSLPADLVTAESGVAQADASLVEARQHALALKLNLEAAIAQVAKAKSDAELAKLTLARNEQIAKDSPGAVSEQDLDVSRASLKSANASVELAIAQQQEAQLSLDTNLAGSTPRLPKPRICVIPHSPQSKRRSWLLRRRSTAKTPALPNCVRNLPQPDTT